MLKCDRCSKELEQEQNDDVRLYAETDLSKIATPWHLCPECYAELTDFIIAGHEDD